MSSSTTVAMAASTSTAAASSTTANTSLSNNVGGASGSNINLNVQSALQHQQQSQHITNLILPATNAIRKRKVKFTVQLSIQELLSVPYLNGVLFCKVRLCSGGNHVSYSSKKEISNSSVIWATNNDDSTIQFDVKVVQLYSVTNLATNSFITGNGGGGGQSQTSQQQQQIYVIGYEPCLCRISVRKELRGGKSYQKLGYVDYNLADFILKYQQDSMVVAATMNNSNNETTNNNIEYCVNRILKEYDTQQAKKNQQRLDNSFLKIKIRINENIVVVKQQQQNQLAAPVNSSSTLIKNKTDQQIDLVNNQCVILDSEVMKPSEKVSSANSMSTSTSASSSISSSLNNVDSFISNDEVRKNKSKADQQLTSLSTSHMRNMSSVSVGLVGGGGGGGGNSINSNSPCSSSNLVNNSYSAPPPNPLPHPYPPLLLSSGHNRSCSNGSIKSNVSFDFMIKNRNKFLEESSTSSLAVNSSSTTTPCNRMNNQQSIESGGTLKPISSNNNNYNSSSSNNSPLPSYSSLLPSAINTTTASSASSGGGGGVLLLSSKPESATMRIIESRLDANEIINAIELELMSSQISSGVNKYNN